MASLARNVSALSSSLRRRRPSEFQLKRRKWMAVIGLFLEAMARIDVFQVVVKAVVNDAY